MASTQLADDVMSLVKGVHFPLVASALGGSLTRVAPGDERLCRLAGAGRFAVQIKAYCFFTQLVVRLAVATLGRSARTARHALRCFTGLRHALRSFTRLRNALRCFTGLRNALRSFTRLRNALRSFTRLHNALAAAPLAAITAPRVPSVLRVGGAAVLAATASQDSARWPS
eukprot:COSAG01_NODE_3755_length_5726_cov_2.726853_3_plen_171_part_00